MKYLGLGVHRRVAAIDPMTRGLKDCTPEFIGGMANVAAIDPMTRGLKGQHVLLLGPPGTALQPLTR